MSQSDRDAKLGKGAPPDALTVPPRDFERLLDELSAGLPVLPTLPADFSRADIYDTHD